jgi:L-2-hydroxyglutarate oxidase LhgO
VNLVPGLRRVGPAEIREIEPHGTGLAALYSPKTAITDYVKIAQSFADDIVAAGGELRFNFPVTSVSSSAGGLAVRSPAGEVRVDELIVCAGIQSDLVAGLAGDTAAPRIIPFRGEYMRVSAAKKDMVRGLIYPVPDPRLPFLGVHLTRHPHGNVLIGPTALLEPHLRSLAWPGTWRVMRRFWRTGVEELEHAVSRRRMVAAAQRFVPDLTVDDVEPAWSSARAQAVGRDGKLYDDFAFSEQGPNLHVRNAPSPAATSSLAIARLIADRCEAK